MRPDPFFALSLSLASDLFDVSSPGKSSSSSARDYPSPPVAQGVLVLAQQIREPTLAAKGRGHGGGARGDAAEGSVAQQLILLLWSLQLRRRRRGARAAGRKRSRRAARGRLPLLLPPRGDPPSGVERR